MDLVRPMRNRFATFLFVLYSSSITAQLFQPEKGGGGGGGSENGCGHLYKLLC